MKYRGKEEIIAEIVTELVKEPKSRTRIMYRASLSFTQLKSYIAVLTKTGLIEENNHLFSITEKGKKWLEAWNILNEILPSREFTI